MNTWKPDRLLRTLLVWSAATFIVFWLPAVRGLMDGPSYEWGSPFGFSGAGTAGDYWFPVLCSVLAITFLTLGWRGGRSPFAVLLLGWHGLLAFGATRLALTRPDDFRFRGDTLGVDVSLAWAGPVLFGGFFLLASAWVVRSRAAGVRTVPAWSARNRVLTWVIVGMLPIEYVLLGAGPPHGMTDKLGVLLTMLQWALIGTAVYPWQPRPAPTQAGLMPRDGALA